MEIVPNESVSGFGACHYENSRLAFRGPARNLSEPYVAFLGGSEVFGRFVEQPLSDLVGHALGVPCVNLGCHNAGVDAFLRDPAVPHVASGAEVSVIQIMGAQNISNRFYRVHPRRNDRFIAPAACLRALYPDLDFTNIHFTRHALQEFRRASADRFELVVDELKTAWVARMSEFLTLIEGRKVLFWMGASGLDAADGDSALDPMFIDRAMVELLRPQVDEIVEYAASSQARRDGTRGMVYRRGERRAAQHMFGPRAHAEVAHVLAQALAPMVGATPDPSVVAA